MRSVAIAVAIADAALRAKGMPSSPSDVTQRLARSPSFFRMEASAAVKICRYIYGDWNDSQLSAFNRIVVCNDVRVIGRILSLVVCTVIQPGLRGSRLVFSMPILSAQNPGFFPE